MTQSVPDGHPTTDANSKQARYERQLAVSMVMTGLLHEINNPLNSIMMNAELAQMLLSSKRSPERMEALLKSISDQCRQAGQLTSRISDFIRSPTVGMSDDVCMNAAMVTARRLIWSIAESNQVLVELDAAEDLPSIPGNAIALSICVAMIMLQIINARFKRIRIGTESLPDGSVKTTLSHAGSDDLKIMPEPNPSLETMCRGLEVWGMIERIVAHHGGSLSFNRNQLSLILGA